jgi:hypothetical protein
VHIINKIHYHLITMLNLEFLSLSRGSCSREICTTTKISWQAQARLGLHFKTSSPQHHQQPQISTMSAITGGPPPSATYVSLHSDTYSCPYFAPLTYSQSLRSQPRRADQSPATQGSLDRAILRVWRDH